MDKKCSKCQETKNIELFNKKGKSFRELCKRCQSIRDKEYLKKYREINKEKCNERCSAWRKNNREKINEYLRKPENRTKDNIRKYKRRGMAGKIKYSDWVGLCNKYENKCLCCGSKEKMTIDHVIPLILGGTNSIENIQPLCGSCNSKKGIKIKDYRL